MDFSAYLTVLNAFATAFAVAFVATPAVKRLAARVGAVDVPKDNRRMHKKPIPLMGGLAIALGFLAAVLLFAHKTAQLIGILIGAFIILGLGIADDIKPLPAKRKLLIQLLAALVPVLSGVQVQVITNFNPFAGNAYIRLGILSIPFTALWIVGMTNAVNFIDGLDGLAVGVSSIATLCILAIALLVSEGAVAVVAAALCGACLGFFPFNYNPAGIFMGDTGALFLGYMLATLSVQGLFKLYAAISFVVPFLVFGLPIFDTTFAIVRRIAAGRPPMEGDRGHLHHRLIDMGFSQKQSVFILYVVSAFLGLTAVLLSILDVPRALLLSLCAFAVALVAVRSTSIRRAVFLEERRMEQEGGGHE